MKVNMNTAYTNTDYRWTDNGTSNRKRFIEVLDCSENNTVYPHYIMGEFSEIAGEPYMAVNRPYHWFLERGQAFLVTRMSMRIRRLPLPLETVIFTAWTRGTEGKSILDDLEVRTEEGELLVSCTGIWKVVSLNEFRVIELGEVAGGLLPSVDKAADAPLCKRITPNGEVIFLGERKIVYTDLDCNHHVNNAVYTKIAEDYLPREFRQHNLSEYFVNFVAPTQFGETLEISGAQTESGYIIIGSCDGAVHFSSEFIF